uniref:Uncharacterized protein n=1 Tax=Sphaerodactylus townsendi TaxID=933632 RepID=A0ACB8FC53_9SAUR
MVLPYPPISCVYFFLLCITFLFSLKCFKETCIFAILSSTANLSDSFKNLSCAFLVLNEPPTPFLEAKASGKEIPLVSPVSKDDHSFRQFHLPSYFFCHQVLAS